MNKCFFYFNLIKEVVEKWGCPESKGHDPDIYVLIRPSSLNLQRLKQLDRTENRTLRGIYRKTKGLMLSSSIPFVGSHRLRIELWQEHHWMPVPSNRCVKDFTAQQRNHKKGDANTLECHCHALCGPRWTAQNTDVG